MSTVANPFAKSKLDETLVRLRDLLARVKDPLNDDWDPLELGLLVSKLEYEELDLEDSLASFYREIVEKFKPCPRSDTIRDQTNHLVKFFTKELGFSGDKSNYYNIRNSFVSDVLVRRKGIPLSLSLVFMGLCRKAGLRALGISFPGHFLVRIQPTAGHFEGSHERAEDWRSQWFVDCFDEGTFLTVEDCEKRLKEWTRGVIPFGPEVLAVASPLDILSRMLRNLRAIVSEKEDWPRLYWILTALIELSPGDRIEALKDRGFLFARMNRFSSALKDLKEFLSSSTDSNKIQHVERLVRYFETQRDEIN